MKRPCHSIAFLTVALVCFMACRPSCITGNYFIEVIWSRDTLATQYDRVRSPDGLIDKQVGFGPLSLPLQLGEDESVYIFSGDSLQDTLKLLHNFSIGRRLDNYCLTITDIELDEVNSTFKDLRFRRQLLFDEEFDELAAIIVVDSL